MKAYRYDLPVGRVLLQEHDGSLTHVHLEGKRTEAPASAPLEETPLLRRAYEELAEYFAGERQSFDIPLAPCGTEFQRRVWDALLDIPYGETRSYKQVAQAIGQPGACRAVGMANHRNPIAIIIPCHRVVGAGGSLVGYGGGLDIKAMLLRLEQKGSPGGHGGCPCARQATASVNDI